MTAIGVANPVLEIENVTVQFGGLKACNDVTFRINEGELFAMIGPNGAGKTTVINAITGVYSPNPGASIDFTDAAGRVVKGVNFVDLIDAGDPVEQAKVYDGAGADELCFLDITASHENRDTLYDVVRGTAEQCFMPLTVGGGVRTVDDIRMLLLAGADKVSINTAAVHRPEFVAEASEPAAAPEVVTEFAGAFESDAHPTAGTASVLGNGTGQRFLRFENFETDNGPDLNVYLVNSSTGDVSDFIDLGDLKGNIGDQNYEIPEGVDLSVYDEVVIWCVRFGVGFGDAFLTPA